MQVTNEQIKTARTILKRGVDMLVTSHLHERELKEYEQGLMDSLSDLTVDMDKYLEDMLEYDLLLGLQYLYDAEFKGDEDFIPNNEEARKILGI